GETTPYFHSDTVGCLIVPFLIPRGFVPDTPNEAFLIPRAFVPETQSDPVKGPSYPQVSVVNGSSEGQAFLIPRCSSDQAVEKQQHHSLGDTSLSGYRERVSQPARGCADGAA